MYYTVIKHDDHLRTERKCFITVQCMGLGFLIQFRGNVGKNKNHNVLSPVKSIRGHWVWSSTAGMASWRNCSDEVDSGFSSESSNSWAAASRLATMDSRLGKSKTWAAGQTPSVSASPSEPLEESLWFPASGLWATCFLFFGLRQCTGPLSMGFIHVLWQHATAEG